MRRAEKLVRATGPTSPAVTRREVMTEDVCAWNMVLLNQPANKCCRCSSLGRGEGLGFSADMFDSDRAAVRAHAMPGRIAVAHGLVDLPIAINDVVGGDRISTAGGLEMTERALERGFGAMQDNLVDRRRVARRMIRALDELFDYRFYVWINGAVTGPPHGQCGFNWFYWYGSAR